MTSSNVTNQSPGHPNEQRPRILIVDDNALVRDMLVKSLSEISECEEAKDGSHALEKLQLYEFNLVITDIYMPRMDGMTLLSILNESHPHLPTIVITAMDDLEQGIKALEYGAYSYIIKPFNLKEVLINVKNALRRNELERENRLYQEKLEELVKIKTKDLTKAQDQLKLSYQEAIFRLALAAEFRDDDTASHLRRISKYTKILGETIDLDPEKLEMLTLTSPLHDIGKIGIPDNILLKPDRLTPEEFEIIKTHTIIGGKILGGSTWPQLEIAGEIALSHHERFDGNGYPYGLQGEKIPLPGRIVAVCDVFDALTSNRPYRLPMTFDKAKEVMFGEMREHFDPKLLEALFSRKAELINIIDIYSSEESLIDARDFSLG